MPHKPRRVAGPSQYEDRESAFLASLEDWRRLPNDNNYAIDAPVFMLPYDQDAYDWAEKEARTIDFGGKAEFTPQSPDLAAIPKRRLNVEVGPVQVERAPNVEVGDVQIDPAYLERLDQMYQARAPNVEVGSVRMLGPEQPMPHYQLDPVKIEIERRRRAQGPAYRAPYRSKL